MRNLVIIVGTVILAAGLAAASEQADVMAPVHQFVDGFNKGDINSALATCVDEVSIIDEFAPYRWSGAGACSMWRRPMMPTSKRTASPMASLPSANPGTSMLWAITPMSSSPQPTPGSRTASQ